MEPTICKLETVRPAGAPVVLKQELYRAPNADFNLIRVADGVGKPPHAYNGGDSLMLVVSGTLRLDVDGKTYDLNAGEVAFLPKGATRGFTAVGGDATFFATHLVS